MKASIILVAFAVLFSSFLIAGEEKGDSALHEIGRYQLIAATLWDPTDGRSVPTIAKIDTVSGRVWMLQRTVGALTMLGEGNRMLIEGWSEIDKSFLEAMGQYEKLTKPPAKK